MEFEVKKMRNGTKRANPNQCLIRLPDGTVVFESYNIPIAKRKGTKVIISKDWKHSDITVNYLSKFLGESVNDIKGKINSGVYPVKRTII